MRILQQLLENCGWGEMANHVCRIHKREKATWFMWLLHDLNTGEQLSGWHGEGEYDPVDDSEWVRLIKSSKEVKSSFLLLYRKQKKVLKLQALVFQVLSVQIHLKLIFNPNTIHFTHMISSMKKNECAKRNKDGDGKHTAAEVQYLQ